MTIHRLLIALAFWALLALPVCCAAGWVLHPCVCDEAESAGDVCDHDSECGDDPCETALVAHRPDGDTRIDPAGMTVPTPVGSAPRVSPSSCSDAPAVAGTPSSSSLTLETPLRL